jgi:hypothetical protein
MGAGDEANFVNGAPTRTCTNPLTSGSAGGRVAALAGVEGLALGGIGGQAMPVPQLERLILAGRTRDELAFPRSRRVWRR